MLGVGYRPLGREVQWFSGPLSRGSTALMPAGVRAERRTRQPRPLDRVLALFDALLCRRSGRPRYRANATRGAVPSASPIASSIRRPLDGYENLALPS